MILVCTSCKNQITLDDAVIPDGVFKVRCTGCGKIITSQKTAQPAPVPAEPPVAGGSSGEKNKKPLPEQQPISPAVEAFIKKEIAGARREILDAIQSLFSGTAIGKSDIDDRGISAKALVCSGDPLTSQTLSLAAQALGHQVQVAVTAADSLKNLDSIYPLILIDPSFGDDPEAGKKLINRINARKAIERRQMFVVLISSTHKTLDGNAAFMNAVNLIVNKADLSALVPSIKQSQKDFQHMYSAYHAAIEGA